MAGIYIESVRLINFQSHEDNTIEFAPGLNFIVGPTNAGKSAIYRAIDWCLFDKGSWQALRRRGAKSMEVWITLTNQVVVKRIRSASINRYILCIPEEEDRVYEAVGRERPEEITRALGFREVELDGKRVSLNMAGQHDGPFLLNDPTAVIQRKLGILTGTDVLENAAMAAHTDMVRADREQATAQAGLDATNTALEQLAWLPQAIKDMEEVEEAAQALKALEREGEAMDNLLVWAESYNHRVALYTGDQQRLAHIDLDAAAQALQEIAEINAILTAIEEAETAATRIVRELEGIPARSAMAGGRVQELETALAQVQVCPTCKRPL